MAGPDFKSENAEIRKAISFVSEHTEKRSIWVLDRGGARRLFGIPDFRFYALADGI